MEITKPIAEMHERLLPNARDKITFWLGMISALTALILVLFVNPYKFEVPVWIITTICASIAGFTALTHTLVPPSKFKSIGQVCIDMIRDRALVFLVFFAIISFIFKLNEKYSTFTVSMCPEIILILLSTVCWNMTSFA